MSTLARALAPSAGDAGLRICSDTNRRVARAQEAHDHVRRGVPGIPDQDVPATAFVVETGVSPSRRNVSVTVAAVGFAASAGTSVGLTYFTIGLNEWETYDTWPPAGAQSMTFYLSSRGSASSLFEDYEARLFASLGRPAPALPPVAREQPARDGMCGNNDYRSAAQFVDAIAADAALAPHAERLVGWRTRLIGMCPSQKDEVGARVTELRTAATEPGLRDGAGYIAAAALFMADAAPRLPSSSWRCPPRRTRGSARRYSLDLCEKAGKPDPFPEVETAARALARTADDPKGLFNVGLFLHQRNGVSGDCCACERLESPPKAVIDGGIAPIGLYADAITTLSAAPDASLELKALHDAIMCFKERSDAAACQRGYADPIPKETRTGWFKRLKAKYPRSTWAAKTPYYY